MCSRLPSAYLSLSAALFSNSNTRLEMHRVGLTRCQSYQALEVMTGKLPPFMIDKMQPFMT